jgi:nitrogen regulatory protein P-II 1
MKKIEAYIKTQRLDEVILRLHLIDGLSGVSVQDMKGFGRMRGQTDPVHIVDNTINWVPHVKIEIFCTDEIKNQVVGAILEGAHTGLRADGKIYISDIEDAIRISTGEQGDTAV